MHNSWSRDSFIEIKIVPLWRPFVCLFSSYLQNWSQVVKAENTVSQSKNILSGVAQGSIIGPLLFLIYVNDLSMHLTCSTEMYADDTTLHESAKSLLTIQANLQTNLL